MRFTATSLEDFQGRLLRWYGKESRKGLPWRGTRDPYRVWVSESMLQQTQVATVIPYYERFLRRFSDLRALSRARLTEVLESWSGLGYYSRAKNLHACARQVVRDHGGRIPSEVAELMELPGIGRTTAGAVASIAYDRPAPVLDGNVQRVLTRFFGFREDPRTPTVQRRLWELASRLVPAQAPGDFNQALMDLGATLCTPRQPRCSACPIAGGCCARRNGWQADIPPARTQAVRRQIRYLCAILKRNGPVLLARRPLSGLLPGLWEFPGGEAAPRQSVSTALPALLLERMGIRATPTAPGIRVKRILSHRELRIEAYPCQWKGGVQALRPRWYIQTRWVQTRRIKAMALTAGMRDVAERI